MAYKIFETNTFQRDFQKLIKGISAQMILRKLQDFVYPQLRKEPHYGPQIKKLKDYSPETFRFRIGSFRLFYCIDEDNKVVIVTTIRLRKDAYK